MRSSRLTLGLVVLVTVLAAVPASAAASEEGCTPAGVKRMVGSFVRAYNRGDVEKLERLWAQEPDFDWYFVQGNERSDPHDRESLGAYFATRHQLGDRLDLERVSSKQGSQGSVGFGFRLSRSSDQRSARGAYHGKGHAVTVERDMLSQLLEPGPATKCVLTVWSMGRD